MTGRAFLSPVVSLASPALAGAFLFAFGEHAFVQAFWPNGFLESDFFYYPGLAVSFAGAAVAGAAWLLAGNAITKVRPAVRTDLWALATLHPLLLLVLLAHGAPDATRVLADASASVFWGPWLARFTSGSCYLALAWIAVRAATRRYRSNRLPGRVAPSILEVSTVLLTAGTLTVMTSRFWFDAFLALYVILLALPLLPLLAAVPLRLWLERGDGCRPGRFSRFLLAAALVFAGFLHADHRAGLGGGAWPWLLSGAPALLLGAAVLFLRARPALAAAMAAAPALLVVAAPWIDDAWRPSSPDSAAPGNHVVLISVDTLRRDAISAYNPRTPPTPHLDALFDDGVRFTRAWSNASWTLPAVVSMLTGVDPAIHQVDDLESRMPDGLPTLAESLRNRGFGTEGYVENLLLSADRGLDRGFDRYVHLPSMNPRTTWGQAPLIRLWPDRFNPQGGSRGIAEIAWRRLRDHRDRRLFLWLHLFEPHSPYEPPAGFWPAGVPVDAHFPHVSNGPIGGAVDLETLRNEMKALYLAEVQYVDACIGLMITRMKQLDLYDDAFILFTSDHGEEFGEHMRWGHGNTPVESLVRMPLAAKLPASRDGIVSAEMVDTAGLASTVLQLADESFRPANHLTASWDSLDPPAVRDAPSTDSVLFATSIPREGERDEALIFGERPWKYVFDRVDGSESLYDLGKDSAERTTLASIQPALLDRARHLYRRHLQRSELLRQDLELEASTDVSFTPAEIGELRDLGYLD